ncbi:MAG: hypothetical protein JW834_01110 [Candidatus Diapherotrites archaeon]|nr:hypothetical protein [Candidatus Diapherotrites archaeon]
MKHSLEVGLSFGLTSGIITTLGLLVGLSAGTHSRLAVVGGVLTIAIADAFSDALGIHISEESEGKHTQRQIWESTFSTFASKFLFASTFLIPLILLDLSSAVLASVAWGLFAIIAVSYFIAKRENENPLKVIFEHVLVTVVVIAVTNYVGQWIAIALA